VCSRELSVVKSIWKCVIHTFILSSKNSGKSCNHSYTVLNVIQCDWLVTHMLNFRKMTPSSSTLHLPWGDGCLGKEVLISSTRHGFRTKPNLLCIRDTLRRESPQTSRWRSRKCNLGIISDINYIPVTGKPTKYSGKPSCTERLVNWGDQPHV